MKAIPTNEKKIKKDEDECVSLDVLEDGFTQQGIDQGKEQKKCNIENLPTSNPNVLKALSQNEDGDAFLYCDLYRDKFLFDCSQKSWYAWQGHYWKMDKESEHMNQIRGVIKLYEEQVNYEQCCADVAKSADKKEVVSAHEARIKRLRERVSMLQTLKRKSSVTKLAAMGNNSLAYHGEGWDKEHMLFPCSNGTINLSTGKFTDGVPDDRLSRVSSIEWKGIDAPCPTWLEYISSSLGNDMELVGFMHRLLGYGITGNTDEHVYPVLWGANGRNGKSTLLEVIKFILGDMAYKLPATYFMVQSGPKQSGSSDAETMALKGRRIIWGSETNQRDKLNVAKLKDLVGGDTLSAREPYGRHQIVFSPTHLLFLLTNKRPRVPADDPALWERIKLIPFLFSFVKNPDPNNPYQKPQIPDLMNKLKAEASGILAWIVQGCLWWQEIGLQPPQSVATATDQYRANEDVMGLFIKEACVTGSKKDSMYRETAKKLYDTYKSWCEDVGHYPMAKKHFIDEMKSKFEYKKQGVWTFRGIAVPS